ncbi:tRNA uridine-5-carboxymethylaminomethyl(34) synthesis GTPase MnmE [Candidatus Synchoanobacter obligatus]|uniref:tRNA modification GTPase MnmE n=1 Tax=Candidatus Synchoanobacter obligatus TaxID=2919597 RepID=A0ABT1L5J3_9GAMM|nr:tRNA uridine-5-carboxymethylaminomethyl(34) synthesis GTPase MnmE [Candidatus Synchoanobacter obligatus]MCP8352206.1 tRNA uridine-5-carboxymethylaminomethyl(34) synthesis GTPase MnmE [Candidatus Synchoanobacter obligatus]
MTTIVAPATAMVSQPIGIIRLSGPLSLQIIKKITKQKRIKVRHAHFVTVYDKEILDHAVVLYFKAPYSFTGEDVVEIQMHGNPYLMENVIKLCIGLGAEMAQPGAFSHRAFLNGKMKLDQVEAVADIIHAGSLRAAKSAASSLEGTLGTKVSELQAELMALRVLVEASIDFSEEDIPVISQAACNARLALLHSRLQALLQTAKTGASLQKGIQVALVGAPNVGKSTLMNAICKKQVSIVTSEAGTTRDVLSQEVIHKGVHLTFFDTAGVRSTSSIAEKIGIEKAHEFATKADLVLLMGDHQTRPLSLEGLETPSWVVYNKKDLFPDAVEDALFISARHGDGVDELLDKILEYFKLAEHVEAPFSARTRQVDVLKRANQLLQETQGIVDAEIVAHNLWDVQQVLSEITGEVSTDDVLGELFSDFCIGK